MRVAAVTGATGFLGRRVVAALSQAGWRVRALVRRDPVLSASPGVEPEVVIGGLSDPAALARLCDGAQAFVHIAGLVKAPNDSYFAAVNVEGARIAAEAARRAGVERMVLVSSLAAREPDLSAYGMSKRTGETSAASVLGERLTVVRPPAIYGPGDRETLGVFEAALRLPVVPAFDPRARIAMIHVDDAARQIAAAIDSPPAQDIVAISDARPEGYTWREIVQAAAQAVGTRPAVVRLPSQVLTLAGQIGSIQRILGGNPILTSGKARELRHLDWGLKPEERWLAAPPAQFGLVEGFAGTVAWWREAGELCS